jgi:hypothetical protein
MIFGVDIVGLGLAAFFIGCFCLVYMGYKCGSEEPQ